MEPIEVGFIFHNRDILYPAVTPKNVKFPGAETLGNWENLPQLNITANST
jgi:hypothetical protein